MSRIDEPTAPEKKSANTETQERASDKKADEKAQASPRENDGGTLQAGKIIGNG